ncbi:hypothetical protein K438DRAFT_1959679 [Mycena galopus ATCC 62051]|nr:hypothetical protein K438DRAFT_1959679 [Mycena galopus ATCC 62051]
MPQRSQYPQLQERKNERATLLPSKARLHPPRSPPPTLLCGNHGPGGLETAPPPVEQVAEGVQRKAKPKGTAEAGPEAAPSKMSVSEKSTRNRKRDHGAAHKSVKFTFPEELAKTISSSDAGRLAQSEGVLVSCQKTQNPPASEKVKKVKGKKKVVGNLDDVGNYFHTMFRPFVIFDPESTRDELHSSSPENVKDQAPLFLPAESQVLFPYSQWNSVPEFCPGSPKDSEGEEEEVAASMKPPQSQRPANASTGSYRRLADIASQPSLFSKTPTLRAMPLATFPSANDKRDSLYGKLPQEDEDSTDSDSSSGGELSVCRAERRDGCARVLAPFLVQEYYEGWSRTASPPRCTCLAAHASTVDKNMTIEITTSPAETQQHQSSQLSLILDYQLAMHSFAASSHLHLAAMPFRRPTVDATRTSPIKNTTSFGGFTNTF